MVQTCKFTVKDKVKTEVRITADGSHSLYVPELDETYHSVHGAIQESQHVFIQMGLHRFTARDQVSILEVGLGTGLNVFLTYLESLSCPQSIALTSLEAYPLSEETVQELNYLHLLRATEHQAIFDQIHACAWEKPTNLSPQFEFRKLQLDLIQQEVPGKYDLIYYDAFGPNAQPDMWTEEVLGRVASALKPNGSLVTYCAKGSVRRALKALGLTVSKLPGPPGKREMTLAERQ